jgi:hypothetical protein
VPAHLERVHAACEGQLAVGLDDQVQVVAHDREVGDSK